MMDTELPKEFVEANDKKQKVIDVINKAKQNLEDKDDVQEVFILVRVGGKYLRYSSYVENSTELISAFELAKHDVMSRM